jgi:hypothetical protein
MNAEAHNISFYLRQGELRLRKRGCPGVLFAFIRGSHI